MASGGGHLKRSAQACASFLVDIGRRSEEIVEEGSD